MRAYNEIDQWSDTVRTLRSTRYQHTLGAYCASWKAEDSSIISDDDMLDAVINELRVHNQADLFDYNRMYLDPDERSIISVLRDDTRHQMGRVLDKADGIPDRRLWTSLVDFYMWIDLAMKCRKARKMTNH